MKTLPNFRRLLLTLCVFFLASFAATAQTRGLIVVPQGGGIITLDPNADGFTSVANTGFSGGDVGAAFSEVPYFRVMPPQTEPTGDLRRGPNGRFSDLVKDSQGAAFYLYYDGTNILVRMRVGSIVPGSKGYTLLLDTDGLFGGTGSQADPNYIPQTTGINGNPGFEYEVTFESNFRIAVYNVDGLGNSGDAIPTVATYPLASNAQISLALSDDSGNPDYFYDFYVPAAVMGITGATPIRATITTIMAPKGAILGPVSDAYGNDDLYGTTSEQWEDVITAQPPFTLTDVGGGGSGVGPSCTAPPTVDGGIATTATSITGTWVKEDFSTLTTATITVYKNNISIGTTTATSGSPWSLGGITVANGDLIHATAQATGESVCLNSNTVLVQNCTPTNTSPAPAITCFNKKGAEGTGTIGATITVYRVNTTGITLMSSVIVDGVGNWAWDGGCSGGANNVDGSYYATQTVAGFCESVPSPATFMCDAQTVTATPVITTDPIFGNTTTVVGTAVASSTVRLYLNGFLKATTTATAGGAWSFTVSGYYAQVGDVYRVMAQVTGQCVSDGATRTVACNISAPVINFTGTNQVAVGSQLSGLSAEPAGQIVTIYNAATQAVLGTATVQADATWTLAAPVVAAGLTYVARHTGGACGTSGPSNIVSAATQTSSARCGTITGPILDNVASVSGGLTGAVANTLVTLYLDGISIGSVTTSGTAWSIPVNTTINNTLYSGGVLEIGIAEPTQLEVICPATVTVTCLPPATPNVIPTVQNISIGDTTGFTVTNSLLNVLYTVQDTMKNGDGSYSNRSASAFGTGSPLGLNTFTFSTPGTYILKMSAIDLFTPSCASERLLQVNVFGPNTNPVAVDDAATTPEDTPLNVDVLDLGTADSDAESNILITSVGSDPLTPTSGTTTEGGTVTINNNGTPADSTDDYVVYTPAADYFGSDTFYYVITDGGGLTDTAQVVMTVTPVNDPPVAIDDVATTVEDTPLNVDVLDLGTADSDIESDILITSVGSTPGSGGGTTTQGGTVTINNNGTPADSTDDYVVYTPAADYFGNDTFYYVITDAAGAPDTAQVVMTVTPVNDPPVAVDDAATTSEDTPLNVDVLDLGTADSDAESNILITSVGDDPLTPTSGTTTQGGTVTINNNGTPADSTDDYVVYTPAADYFGSDTFYYVITDGGGLTDTALVVMTVTPVNDPPVAVNDAATTAEDTPLNVDVLDLGTADSDIESDILITSVGSTPGSGGGTTTQGGTVTINNNGTPADSTDDYVVYTPAADYFGNDTFYYVITDAAGAPDTAQVVMTVTPVNDPPVAVDDAATTSEDTPLNVDVLDLGTADSDAESNILITSVGDDPLTPTSGTTTQGGTVTINNNGTPADSTDDYVVYTPAADYFGSDTFYYVITDGGGLTDTALVVMTVTPVNDPPVAVNDAATTAEDTPLNVDVLDLGTADSDIESDILITSVGSTPGSGGGTTTQGGTVTINNNGTPADSTDDYVVYTPAADYFGNDTFYYVITDAAGAPDTAQVVMTVTPVNDPPVAVDDAATTPEDTPLNVDVLDLGTADSDAESDILITAVGSTPGSGGGTTTQGGTVTINNNGTPADSTDDYVVYTPAADYFGNDTFYYVITDAAGAPDTAQVVMTVTPVNDPPVAVDDAATTPEDTPLNVDVLDSGTDDSDIESDILITSVGSDPLNPVNGATTQGGTVTINNNGTLADSTDDYVVYTPAADYFGNDTFYYVITDAGGATDTAEVVISVTPVNDPPVAVDDATTTPEDTPLSVDVLDQGTADSDAESDILITAVGSSSGSNDGLTTQGGTVTYNDNGTPADSTDDYVDYTPATDYVGTDVFYYEITDGGGLTDIAMVTITVLPVTDTTFVTTPEDTPVTQCTDTETNIQGTITSLSLCGNGAYGDAVLGILPCVTYTPDPDYVGNDTACVITCTNLGFCDTTIIVYTVTPVNDPPVAVDDIATTNEDTDLVVDVLDLGTPDSDLESNILITAVGSTSGSNDGLTTQGGTVTYNDNGTPADSTDDYVDYTPATDYVGTDVFYYEITDGAGLTDIAMVTITVLPVTDTTFVTTPEDTPVTQCTDTETNIQGTITSVSICGQPDNGDFALGILPCVTYSPDADYVGNDTACVITCTNLGFCDTTIIVYTVTPVNDPPVAVDDIATTNEDTDLVVDVLDLGTPDSDLESNILITAVGSTSGSNDGLTTQGGTVTYNDNGTPADSTDDYVDYTPATDYVGTDVFYYEITDGGGLTDIAMVTITVLPVTDTTFVTTPEDTPVTQCTDTETNIQGTITSVSICGVPDNGDFALGILPCVTYSPDKDYVGNDTACVITCTNLGLCDTTIIVYTVTPVNDPPVAVDDEFDVCSNATLSGDVYVDNGNGTDYDIEGNSWFVSSINGSPANIGSTTLPSGALLTAYATGLFDYDPNGQFPSGGSDSFTYTIYDGDTSNVATVTITIVTAPNAGTDGSLNICPGTTVTAAELFAELGGSPETGGTWSPAPAGANTYTYTVVGTPPCADETANVVVTESDTVDPVITCAADQTQSTDPGSCDALVTVLAPTASDNCSIDSVWNDFNNTVDATDTYPISLVTITWTAVDASGNTATCTQNITVTDDEDPVATCAADQTQTAAPGFCGTSVTVMGPATSDNCGINSVVNDYNFTSDASGIYPVGTTTVTWTVADDYGNSVTCTQDITVTDDEDPSITCAADQTQTADAGECEADVTVTAPATSDNCGVASVTNDYTNTADASGTYPVGTTTVTWTVTDDNGNTATCTQDITVTDDEDPTISCPADMPSVIADAGECYATIGNIGTPVTGDNCGIDSVSNDAPANYAVGTTTVTWTVVDLSGNSASCTQDIEVVDQEDPVITCGADQTQTAASGFCGAAVTVPGPATSDNCGVLSVVNDYNFTNDASGNYPVGTTTVTWTVSDPSGNSATCTQDITVTDDEDPTITCAAAQSQTADAGECEAAVTVTGPATSDNCGVASITNDFNGTADASDDYPVGTTTVTWTVTDDNGNTATCTQDITVTDNEDPTIGCPADLSSVIADDGECYATIGNIGTPVIDDNCAIDSVSNDAPATYAVGTTTVTWTVVDLSGNSSSCTQDITVVDQEDPTITCGADQTQPAAAGFCGAAVTVPGPTAGDNCGILSVVNDYNFTSDASGNYPVGTTTVTWTATDLSGNTVTCTQEITVTDDQDPMITCAGGQAQTADPGECTAAVIVNGPATGDNCGVASLTNDFNGTADASDDYPVGTTTITWTVTDDNGNTETCTQDITVTDDEDPTIGCPGDMSVVFADAGECFATIGNIGTPVTDDNCGVASVSNDAPATFPVGTTTVTWTVIDDSGNSATCTQDITVLDFEDPAITCAADQSQSADAGSCDAVVTVTAPAASDNCAVDSIWNDYTFTSDASGTYPVGTTTVTWYVVDIHGNSSACAQDITVTDGENPVVSCPANFSGSADPITCTASLTFAATATDNCDSDVEILYYVGASQITFPYDFPAGATNVMVWAIDDAGNAEMCSFDVDLLSQPVADPNYASTTEDTPVLIDALDNDVDCENDIDPITTNNTCPECTDPANGSVINNGDGTFTYTPDVNFAGDDAFIYQVCDLDGQCDTSTIFITVAPEPDTLYVTIPEDSTLVVCTDSLTNLQGGPFVVTLCGTGDHGNANEIVFPCVEYTPDVDYNGNDTICITTCNSAGLCDTTYVVITIAPVNDPPVAVDDEETTPEDTPVDIDVTSNDTDLDGVIDPTTVTIVSGPSNGSVVVDPITGVVTYTPDTDYIGTDVFEYSVCDDGTPVLCDIAEVVVTITPVPDTTYVTTPEETPVTVCTDSLTNFAGAITSAFVCGEPSNGAPLTISGDCFTYTPDDDYNGQDTACVISCSGSLCDTTIIIYTVTPVNDGPVAVDDEETTPEDTPVDIDVTDNDYDIDGVIDPTTVTITSGPSNGSVVVDPITGVVTYTPDTDYIGTDVFEYSVCDDGTPVLCDIAEVVVTITPVPDTTYVTTPEETPVTVCTDSLTNFAGAITSAFVCGEPSNGGPLDISGDCFTYTPDDDYNGQDTACVITCSGSLCDTTIIIYTVTPVNDGPVAVDDEETTPEDTPVDIDVTVNDYDIDGVIDPTTVTIVSGPSNGSVVVDPITGVVTYTPDTDYVGTDVFEYSVCDDGTPVLCDIAEVVVTITPLPDTAYVTTPEDTPITVCTDTETNIQGTITSLTICGNGTNGNLVLGTLPCATYTPDPDYVGLDTVCVITCTDLGLCDTTIYVIDVTPVNDGPVAVDDEETTPEDTPVDIDVTVNDYDIDGVIDPTTVTIVSGPSNGSVVVDPITGVVTYTPDTDYVGTDVFEYSVCDDGTPVLCDIAEVVVTITPLPDTTYVTTPEDTPITVCTDTETNIQGTITSLTICGNGTNGNLVLGTLPCATYTPDADYVGLDTVCVITCTNLGLCDTTIYVIDVTPVNDGPVAVDDEETTPEDTPVDIDVTDNDYDIDGVIDPTTVTIVSGPSNGSVVVDPVTGVVTYTPDTDYIGTDVFEYSVCDDGTPVLCDIAEVVVTITPVTDTTYVTTPEETPITVCTDTLTNFAGAITSAFVCGEPANGAPLDISGDCFTYTPDDDYNGQDTACVITCSGSLCDTTIIIYTVTPVNDAPVAVDDEETTPEDTPVDIDVTSNDYDIDGVIDPTTVTIVSGPSNGSVVVDPITGVVTYTPDTDYVGTDVFEYSVCDDGTPVLCDIAEVVVTITPLPDTTYVTTPEDTPITVCTDTETNIQGTITSLTICGNGTNGELVLGTLPCATYTPDPDYVGLDTVCVITCTNLGLCDTTIYVIDVTPVNDAPVAVDDEETTPEDTPVDIDVTDNDYDIDGVIDPTTVTITSGPSNGSVVVDPITGVVTYTPDTDYVGTDVFEYSVCDDGTPVLCDIAEVVVTITPLPDTTYVTTPEDTPITVCTDTETNIQGTITSLTICGNGTNGELVLGTLPCATYTPDADYVGLDTVCVITCTNLGLCDTTIYVIDVTPVNDAPVAVDDEETTPEDTPVDIDVTSNDYDIDGVIDPTTVTIVSGPSNGSVVVDPITGVVTYTPDTDYVGTDVFEYSVCDDGTPVLCDIAEVVVTITPLPDTAYVTTPEDTPITVCTDTETNIQGTITSLTICGNGTNGELVLGTLPCATYTPDADYVGLDTVCVITCTNLGLCDTTIYVIDVTPVNDAPVAVDDEATTPEDTPVDIDVTSNDYDIDGVIDPTTVTIVSGPSNGTVVVDPVTGIVTYTPDTDYVGTDVFEYSVCDDGTPVLCDIAEVVVTIQPTPDTTYTTTPEDTPLTVCTDSLTNLQGTINTVTICGGGEHGTTVVSELPCVTYTPDDDYFGPDTVCVITCAGTLCDTTIIVIDVTPVNDPPIAVDDEAVTTEDTPVVIDVIENDYDIDGPIDPASVTILDGPSNGTVAVNGDGTVTYTPEADFAGLDTFLYSVCDTGMPVLCDMAQVVITVQPAPDTVYATTPEDVVLTVCTDSTTNIQGGILDVNICGDGQHGDAEPSTLPCVDYTPDENYFGADTICILTCGPNGICDTTIVIIDVTPVNDPPVAVDDVDHTPEDVPVVVDVLDNDYDIDGVLDPGSVTVIEQPTNGTAVANADGTITYTPDEDFIGIDTFIYEVCDTGMPVLCDQAEVVIYVGPQSDTIYVTMLEDGLVVLCTDTVAQIDGPIVTTVACEDPAFGEITVLPSLCVEYAPNPDYNGQDTICVINCNDRFQCDTTIIILTIDPVNDQPVANDDYAVTEYITPVDIDVVANDNDDIDGGEMDPTSVVIITDPVNGSVVNNGDGTVTYTPVDNFIGTDSFDYVVCDLGIPLPALCDTARVYVTVVPTKGDDCFIPESFSPNGDGLYDFFEIPCAEFFPELELDVYNRWGDVVYTSGIGYQNNWNGDWEKKAVGLPDGTYYWVVKFNDGISRDRAGYLYILR